MNWKELYDYYTQVHNDEFIDFLKAKVKEEKMENKEKPIIHKVDQHCSLSECGKTTHKDNRSPVWKGVNCPDCLKVRKPYGRRKY